MNFYEGKKKDLIASIVCFIILLAIGLSMAFAPLISSENIAEKYAKRLDYKIIREEKEEKSDKKDNDYYSYDYSEKEEEEEPSEEEIEIQRDLNAIKKTENNITLKTEITMFLKYMKYSDNIDGDNQIIFNSEWTTTCIILILLGGGIVISLICCIIQIFSWIFSKYSYGMSCMMLKFVFIFWVITTVLLGLQYNYFSVCQEIGIIYLLSGLLVILFFVINSLLNILCDLKQNENKYKEVTNHFALVLVMILAIFSFTNISGNIIGVDASAYDGNIPIIFTGVTGSSLLNIGIEGKASSEYEEETEKIISQEKQKNNEDEISKEYRNMIKGFQSLIVCGIFLISVMLITLIIFLINASSKLTRVQLALNIIFAAANIGLFVLFRVKMNEVNDYFGRADMYGLKASLMMYSGIFLNVGIILINFWKIKVNHIIQKNMVSETNEQPVVE